ncbi:terminase large subunit domain-containing protein [Azotobacter beijerinckii]|uniref:terminase large subunit domain-containing protein n=1 Tax=Azotobacter beijerinckii TaxID=170623 RepID=UPI002954D106|nr:terminase family protein [Azotobacter beijerinckii]MDV7209917.1 terminase family protein [Azotobacter beijerinckii]
MPSLNVPQASFLALPHKFRAFVAGFGSGKTWVGSAALCRHFWEWPKINAGYFAPTYPQIRDIFFPTIEEVAFDWGLKVKTKESDKEVEFYSGRQYRGTTICRSMEKPQTIVGFKIGHALVDELDVLAATKAQQAWRKIIARMRYKVDGLKNGVDVTTTPEGFKFVYQQFVKQLREKPSLAGMYGLVQASTFDNELNLPSDYIPSLMESYPEQLIRAYLNGQFVNLTSGTIYHGYDRKLNASQEVVEPGEPLFIGMDFNVGKMAAVTHVKRLGLPHAVDEVMNAYDTPDMIRRLKERYWLYADGEYRPTREIRIYPDASGDGRRSVNASTTDLQLLKQAGFKVIAPAANPPVKDRINAMNAMLCNAQGERRYRVNADRCPTYADCLEQQVWAANGEPDKTQDNDHPNDAAGYFVHKEYPIVKPVIQTQSLRL